MRLPFVLSPLLVGSTTAFVASAQDGSTWQAEGDQAGARFGSALATADVNGDGFGDLVVGAPLFDDQFHDEGRVSVYLGSAGGLATTPAWVRHGRQTGAHLGAVVVNAGDVNGDGFDDIAFSAPEYDVRFNKWNPYPFGSIGVGGRYAPNEGRVVVYLGSASGLGLLPNRVLDGIEFREHFGTALAGVGDVNGDGYDDLLAGAPGKSEGRGGALLFPGSASGTGGAPLWIGIGPVGRTGYGRQVAAAGDTNGDGFADFQVERNVSTCSKAVLLRGSSAGPGPEILVNEAMVAFGPAVDLDQDGLPELFYSTEGCAGSGLRWRKQGSSAVGRFPTLASPTAILSGDFDGDGFADIMASQPSFSQGPKRGRVFGYMGRAGQITPPESYPNYEGDQEAAEFGAAMAAIDVDGDGADELLIGAPAYDGDSIDEGRVWLFPGHPRRLVVSVTPTSITASSCGVGDFDSDGFSDLVAGSEVRYGTPGGLPAGFDEQLVVPPLAFSSIVYSDHSVGDVNGDGFDDVLVSYYPYFITHGGYLAGYPHALHLGSSSGLDPVAAAVVDGQTYTEGEIVGDVNADGFDDLIITGGAVDTLYLGSAGLPQAFQTFPGSPLASSFGQNSEFEGAVSNNPILGGNIDGDPYADVVIARVSESVYFELELYRGSPTGLQLVTRWRPQPLAQLYYFMHSPMGFTDLDGDGLDDLLIEGAEPMLFSGSPTGFTARYPWWKSAAASSPWSRPTVAVCDLDGDGRDDLVHGGLHLHLSGSSGPLRGTAEHANLYYYGGKARPSADFDGDGLPEFLLGTVEYPRFLVVAEVDSL